MVRFLSRIQKKIKGILEGIPKKTRDLNRTHSKGCLVVIFYFVSVIALLLLTALLGLIFGIPEKKFTSFIAYVVVALILFYPIVIIILLGAINIIILIILFVITTVRIISIRSAFDKGEYDKALELCQRALEPDSEKGYAAAVYGWSASIFRVKEMYEEAIEQAEKALEFDPQRIYAANTHKILALVAYARGMYDQAINHYHLAFQLKPRYVKLRAILHAGLGRVYCKQQDFDKGMKEIQKALEMKPKDSIVLYYSASAYSLQGKANDALNALEKAVKFGYKPIDLIEKNPDFDDIRDKI